MSYVGTAQNLGNDRDTLASIIAGEAGNQGVVGMQAVASVIQNRARTNFSGYGADLVAQATARRQFQGQARATPQAYTVADQLLAGALPDVTGGALYYANPGASTATWARRLNNSNALQIGAHYFTDNTRGEPFAGTSSFNGYVNADGTPAGNTFTDPTSGQTPGWAAHDVPGFNVTANATNVPLAIDQQTVQQAQTGAQQAVAITGAAQTTASTAATIAKTTLDTQQSWLQQIQNAAGDYIVRTFIVLLGLIMVGGALYMLATKQTITLPTISPK